MTGHRFAVGDRVVWLVDGHDEATVCAGDLGTVKSVSDDGTSVDVLPDVQRAGLPEGETWAASIAGLCHVADQGKPSALWLATYREVLRAWLVGIHRNAEAVAEAVAAAKAAADEACKGPPR